MGQQVSRVFGFAVKRPLQRYNVEHRAAAEIARIEDPKGPAMRAPMFDSDKQLLEQLRHSNPELAKANVRKDQDLHTRLRDVYITSEDPDETPKPADNPSRPLPEDRSQYAENFVPGMMRVDKRKAVRGRVTIDQAVKFITDHNQNPNEHSAEHIANTYRLNPETTANSLKYFRLFNVYIPEVKEEALPKGPDQLGKDWVEGVIEKKEALMDYHLEKEERLKKLKEQQKERDKQKLLGGS